MELRDLPSVDALSARLDENTLDHGVPRPLVQSLARDALDEARRDLLSGQPASPLDAARRRLGRLAALRPAQVINATGVVLHTNLGRAPLSASAAIAAADQATGYGNLEFDLTTGGRGGRGAYVAELLTSLTGAESALVVNNNAGGLFLALAALAAPGKVLVSRGELIEIGGSFRLPALMAASGVDLTEIGTTNRTRLDDYRAAADDAALLLKVHPSNYRIEGFSEEVGYRDLAVLADECAVPFVADLGSGLLDSRTPWLEGPPPAWLAGEPAVRQTLEGGAGVVLFSGDKLLGGPQAGIAVGDGELITAMAKHPVARALRVDGVTLAALATTLELYASGHGTEIPFWHRVSLSYDELAVRHDAVLRASGVAGSVIAAASVPGAGSVPGELIPSPAIALTAPPDAAWQQLIAQAPPVVGRRRDDTLQIDLRSVAADDDHEVAAALRGLA
jgi:L-seryl-tRNA(Ser) seleniumtransferase